jgi:5,10-methenyltetrahydrofolate synthetase
MSIPEELKQWRKEQRIQLLAQRDAVAPYQHRKWNDAITLLLLEGFPVLQNAEMGCYWPYRGEFDPRPAIRCFRQCGARAGLPVVVQKSSPLQFREWWPGASMRTTGGAFNLPVPEGTSELMPEALLIPPVGFDERGFRLGYGGGYYDRTLSAMAPQPLKIGVAFELSRIPTIRPQPHDVPMDFIVTEAGIHHVSEDGLRLVTGRSQVHELVSRVTEAREQCL